VPNFGATHYIEPKVFLAPEIQKAGYKNICIIGAGVSGIGTARILIDEGMEVTVLEKTDKLSGVWAEGYVGFGIQVPGNLYEFPDQQLPQGPGWDFAAGPMIANYINQYAQKHGVTDRVEFNSEVLSVEPDGEGYEVTYKQNGREKKQRYDLIIIATGVYSQVQKFIPDWKGQDKFEGKVLHSNDYLHSDHASEKNVITVGYGKSAFDCAMISAKVATSSTLLFRECHWCVPRKILDIVPFEWATFSRFGVACLKPMYPTAGPFEWLLHAIPGFLTCFWWLVGQIFAFQFGLRPQKEGDVDLMPKKGFIEDFWCGHGILPHPNFFPMVRSGAINAVQGEIKEIKANSVVLASGQELPCCLIVAATGYKQTRSYLPQCVRDLREKDGIWLYRNMIHPDHQNLIFLNCETTTFTNITTGSLQGRWLVELLAGNHKLPSKDEMFADIKKTRDWKMKYMPNAGPARSYMIQTHQVHYYDQLLKDMGACISRKWAKGGFLCQLREVFEPYRPRDYDTIVTGEWKHIEAEYGQPGARQGLLVPAAAVVALCVAIYVHNKIFMAGLMS